MDGDVTRFVYCGSRYSLDIFAACVMLMGMNDLFFIRRSSRRRRTCNGFGEFVLLVG